MKMSNQLSSPIMGSPALLPYPAAYLVSYDLKTPNVSYEPLFKELQSSVDWFHYLTNTWIVLRKETLVDFNGVLLKKIYAEDRLLILPAKGPGFGWLPNDAWHWLNRKLIREW